MTYIDIFTWISKHSCFSYTNTSNVSTKKNNARKQKDSSRVKKCFNKHLQKCSKDETKRYMSGNRKKKVFIFWQRTDGLHDINHGTSEIIGH